MSHEKLIPALLLTCDLIGTFVFAISGAAAGVKNRLDLFGVCVLAMVAATAGGLVRDVLIGAVPPAAITDWRYLAVSILAALAAFLWYPRFEKQQRIILLFDAAGLAIFAVAGTQKALAFGINPMISALLGVMTGIGGGVMRDLLIREIPLVLRTGELYAMAALSGTVVIVAGSLLHAQPVPVAIAGVALAFGIRLLAMRRGWNLPVADHLPIAHQGD